MAASYQRDVRVLVVDDQNCVRSAIGELVAAMPGFALVGDATCGEEALEATLELSPELVVMDICMPGAGGLATARLMAERHPHIVILLVSARDPEDISRELSGMAFSFASKWELRASVLREVWNQQQAPREADSAVYSS